MVLGGARFCLLVMLTTVRSFLLAGAILLQILLDDANAFCRHVRFFGQQAQHFRNLRYGDADAPFRHFRLFAGRRASFRCFFRVSHLRVPLFVGFVLAGAVLSRPRMW